MAAFTVGQPPGLLTGEASFPGERDVELRPLGVQLPSVTVNSLSAAACGCKHNAPNMADSLIRGSESLGRLLGETLGVAGRTGDRDSPRD